MVPVNGVDGTPDLKIDALYAYLAQGKEGEGVMGMSVPINGQMMMLPMVGADIDRIKSLLPPRYANCSGKRNHI